ncbi:hypothetical protein CH298_13495 [Rhodococcoides fascians]|nr:hypothetical protein CH303_13375 [Rhodococcus fascians]OZF18298.1 hypothetical protein CH298_13495 [Rhodococcus fascians]OZF21749.1 hypothetical protein CH297_13390 [Rhodococcus fascians]OZF67374.1 hypothetical protein CH308_13290 [Rhodococcus fascians]OZF70564.1 hypothetical protein CH307_13485 [Rhodococcus fascians]
MVGRVWPRIERLRLVVTEDMAFVLQLSLLTAAISRGIDYVRLPMYAYPATLSQVEALLPFHIWGWIFIGTGVVGLIGVYTPRLPLAALAHGVLAALFVGFAFGALAEVMDKEGWYGWRTASGWLFGAVVVHAVLFSASKTAFRQAWDRRCTGAD